MSANLGAGLGGAASGAMAGAPLGPWGAVAGGVIGGLGGLFGGGGSDVDYAGMMREQNRANRPDQFTPFGFSDWTEGPNGEWSQRTGFSGQMQNANEALQAKWVQNAAQGYGTGEDAFNKAWGAQMGLLNPLWDQRENAARSKLSNAGADLIDQTDPQGAQGMQQFNDARSRADMQAMMGAFDAQGQMFNQNRQAWMDPLQAMQGMQNLITMPGVPQASGAMGAAAGMQSQNEFNQGQQADMWNQIGALAGTAAQNGWGGNDAPFMFGTPTARNVPQSGLTMPSTPAIQPFSFGGQSF